MLMNSKTESLQRSANYQPTICDFFKIKYQSISSFLFISVFGTQLCQISYLAHYSQAPKYEVVVRQQQEQLILKNQISLICPIEPRSSFKYRKVSRNYFRLLMPALLDGIYEIYTVCLYVTVSLSTGESIFVRFLARHIPSPYSTLEKPQNIPLRHSINLPCLRQ